MAKPNKLQVVDNTTSPVDAVTLKEALWHTLQGIKGGSITPASGDAIASQAREILRTVRTQLAIFSQSGKAVSTEVIDFARPE
jgi:DeoR/GlpR family transcriptional regulator of sugar metabolism